jgi:hypothetical protein
MIWEFEILTEAAFWRSREYWGYQQKMGFTNVFLDSPTNMMSFSTFFRIYQRK